MSNKPESPEDRVLGAMIEDALTGRDAPDLTESILARAAKTRRKQAAQPRGRLIRWIGSVAAAAAVVFIVMLLIDFRDVASLPEGVIAGDGATLDAEGEQVLLREGWAVVTSDDVELIAGGHRVRGTRYVASLAGLPEQEQRDAIARWVETSSAGLNEQELEVIKAARNWMLHGAVALCALGGALYVDGQDITAQDRNGPEVVDRDDAVDTDPRDEGAAPSVWVVRDQESLHLIPTGTKQVVFRRINDTTAVLEGLADVTRPMHPGIQTVVFEHCREIDGGLAHLARHFSGMTELVFRNCDVTNIGGLARAANLARLHFESCGSFVGNGLESIAAGWGDSPESSLTELVFRDTPFSTARLVAIADLPHLQNLVISNSSEFFAYRYLMTESRSDERKAEVASSFGHLRRSSIRSLTIAHFTAEYIAVTDESGTIGSDDILMRSIAAMPNLRTLTLSDSPVFTAASLEPLTASRTLEALHLNGTGVGEGIAALASRMPALTTLSLNRATGITEAELTELVGVTSLRTLSLRENAVVTDDVLAALVRSSSVQTLDISHCPYVTGAGITALIRAEKLRVLRAQGLRSVSDDAWKQLTEARPNLQVNR